MEYKGMFIQYDMGMGVSRLPFYFVEGIDGKFKTEALAKRAITMHLNRKDSEVIVAPMGKQTTKVIEVVPRTQQEIDDYGPNGIQPPIRKDRSYLDEVISRFKPVMKVAESRNQSQGKYCGKMRSKYTKENCGGVGRHIRFKGEFPLGPKPKGNNATLVVERRIYER